jgi:hypothetical protein
VRRLGAHAWRSPKTRPDWEQIGVHPDLARAELENRTRRQVLACRLVHGGGTRGPSSRPQTPTPFAVVVFARTRKPPLEPLGQVWRALQPDEPKLGTVLATSAPRGHYAKTPRWRRAILGFADFKHHRNLFPMPRSWQTYRTQNPVG